MSLTHIHKTRRLSAENCVFGWLHDLMNSILIAPLGTSETVTEGDISQAT